jgi:uncharacterized protein (TIGR02594 family)
MTISPKWLVLARAEMGTHEGAGASNNPRVVRYFADAGFPGIKADSVPWCAGFVGAMLHRAGIKPSGSLLALSYEHWGVALKAPVLGCVATKRRVGGGHVGFVIGANAHEVILLGGNQGDRVSIESIPRNEITAYRWPAGVPVPAKPNLPTTIAGAAKGVSEA